MWSEGGELIETFEPNHQTFFVGGPGWLAIRLFTALIRNTYTFFFLSKKLEVLSELVNPANFTNQTFIMRHRPVAPGWRVSRTSVAMCTCTRVGHVPGQNCASVLRLSFSAW